MQIVCEAEQADKQEESLMFPNALKSCTGSIPQERKSVCVGLSLWDCAADFPAEGQQRPYIGLFCI